MVMDDIPELANASSPIVSRELSSSNNIDTNEEQDEKAPAIVVTLLGMMMDDIPVPANAPSIFSRELSSSNVTDTNEEHPRKAPAIVVTLLGIMIDDIRVLSNAP